MEKIPMEWVDKLFVCMEQFYGDKWFQMLGQTKIEMWKAIWQSALIGLDHETIKRTLLYYRSLSKSKPSYFPPHQMDFYHKAKEFNCFT